MQKCNPPTLREARGPVCAGSILTSPSPSKNCSIKLNDGWCHRIPRLGRTVRRLS
ncbi:hypothetical protein BGW80DRAFT_1330273 [Lactifluus volemus]|nr:hypothetical protein BGW80DRAFT_1330273 [Lactifluus volemus]